MSERQRNQNQQQRRNPPDSGGGPEANEELAGTRADAERLLGIADDAFERIRSADSLEHVLRHRQRGGQ